jgi:stress response protein YsnF
VLVIPVLEEMAVVEKRLVLREEVRVSRRSTTTTASHVVTLRREVAEVERVEPDAVATTTTAPVEAERPHPHVDREQDSTDQKKGGSS